MGSGIDVLGAARGDQAEEDLLAAQGEARGRGGRAATDNDKVRLSGVVVRMTAEQSRGAWFETIFIFQIWETKQAWMAASKSKLKCVNAEFLRKYLTLAKSFKPALTAEASAYISERYAELRELGALAAFQILM
jgi:DNA replicative helicase MCM subunit Mcm2 (Cdc46/Mcm family)